MTLIDTKTGGAGMENEGDKGREEDKKKRGGG